MAELDLILRSSQALHDLCIDHLLQIICTDNIDQWRVSILGDPCLRHDLTGFLVILWRWSLVLGLDFVRKPMVEVVQDR